MEDFKEDTEEIKRICSWCNKLIGMKEVPISNCPDLRGVPTHGICDDCYKNQLKEISHE